MAQRPDMFRWVSRMVWGMIVYLIGFILLLLLVFYRFFIPAAAAAHSADSRGRHIVGAYSWLVMAIVLVYVLAGLILVFRIGRFFFPRPRDQRTSTQYIDAWTEAGKRAKTPPPDQDKTD
ncbi:MAG TPA: hypothetical protein VMD30_07265 [Tepidisphaeraceae bacterium]|nr:hypothetical protein [Tepidisphaeraceae bacterium]